MSYCCYTETLDDERIEAGNSQSILDLKWKDRMLDLLELEYYANFHKRMFSSIEYAEGGFDLRRDLLAA